MGNIYIYMGNPFWNLIQRFASVLALHRAKNVHFYNCVFVISLLYLGSSVVFPNCALVYISHSYLTGGVFCCCWFFSSLYVTVSSQLHFYCLVLVLFSKIQVFSNLCCFYQTSCFYFSFFFSFFFTDSCCSL